jgi:hypothetical protein
VYLTPELAELIRGNSNGSSCWRCHLTERSPGCSPAPATGSRESGFTNSLSRRRWHVWRRCSMG